MKQLIIIFILSFLLIGCNTTEYGLDLLRTEGHVEIQQDVIHYYDSDGTINHNEVNGMLYVVKRYTFYYRSGKGITYFKIKPNDTN